MEVQNDGRGYSIILTSAKCISDFCLLKLLHSMSAATVQHKEYNTQCTVVPVKLTRALVWSSLML